MANRIVQEQPANIMSGVLKLLVAAALAAGAYYAVDLTAMSSAEATSKATGDEGN